MIKLLAPDKLPVTVSALSELLVHVWLLLIATGPEIVTGAAPEPSVMPLVDASRPLADPCATVTEVTDAGTALNVSDLTPKKLSSVVLSAPPVVFEALKITSVFEPGVTPELMVPAASLVQFVTPDNCEAHELPATVSQ